MVCMCVCVCVCVCVCARVHAHDKEYNHKEIPVKFLFDMHIIAQVLLGVLFTCS